MPRYQCLNAKCAQFEKVKTESSVIVFAQGKIIDSAENCPVCGEQRICLPEEGMPTAFHGSPNICKH